jgi:uncharacterized SAM-binding protein YcdF (DUF218 family)
MKGASPESQAPGRSLRKVIRGTWFALALLGLLFVLVTVTPVTHWWATLLAGRWQAASGDVLIVLGGSVLEDGTIGGSSYWRGVYAARAWQAGHFSMVVVAGGGGERRPVAEAMREFLEYQGVPADAILVELRSTTTRENAIYTKELLAGVPGRKVLVTSDYHMFRARRAFEKAGLEVTPMPYPDVRKRVTRWRGRWPAFLDLLVETAKVAYYYARGWI